MRVMFMAAPGSGLFLPTIPLAWACRAAGHEVLVANTGAASTSIAHSGFSTVDSCPDKDVQAEFLAAGKAIMATPAGQPRPRRGGMGLFGEEMAHGLLQQARDFRPDLIVSTLEQGAGPLIAATLGIPQIEQSVRLAWAGSDEQAAKYRTAVSTYLEPTRERLGLRSGAEPVAVLDCRPKSVGGLDDLRHWPVRYVPYNEGRVLSAGIAAPSLGRPRICLTMGSVLPTADADTASLAWLIEMFRGLIHGLAELDVEVVLALGEEESAALGGLPDNVRAVGWVPLSALLPNCSAIVHHGGAGSSLSALVAGIPHLVLPRAADQPANAAVLVASGVAISVPLWEAGPEVVRDHVRALLGDSGHRSAALAVRNEVETMPTPAATVSRLEQLIR